MEAEQRQKEQRGPESLEQRPGRRAVGQVRRTGLQLDPQHPDDVAQEHEIERHRHDHRHHQHLRVRRLVDPTPAIRAHRLNNYSNPGKSPSRGGGIQFPSPNKRDDHEKNERLLADGRSRRRATNTAELEFAWPA